MEWNDQSREPSDGRADDRPGQSQCQVGRRPGSQEPLDRSHGRIADRRCHDPEQAGRDAAHHPVNRANARSWSAFDQADDQAERRTEGGERGQSGLDRVGSPWPPNGRRLEATINARMTNAPAMPAAIRAGTGTAAIVLVSGRNSSETGGPVIPAATSGNGVGTAGGPTRTAMRRVPPFDSTTISAARGTRDALRDRHARRAAPSPRRCRTVGRHTPGPDGASSSRPARRGA